jgi:hypothetical protein
MRLLSPALGMRRAAEPFRRNGAGMRNPEQPDPPVPERSGGAGGERPLED